ncbi:hypothetical protein MATL_G00076860 [Megalops atlanticus]|uniref:Uncharacterized protein n=1 Tax=Megalops atlanticus TaxID=7932 RepID=A0A9D3Q5B2_MEGAT|nr:hypothetical protein MATL_G00076860 [Megalops atlanticus]
MHQGIHMELAADCTMIPIKTMPVNKELPHEIAELHKSHREQESRAEDGEEEVENHSSITSVSPSPMESPKQTRVNSDDKPSEEFTLQSLLASPHPEDSLSNMGHHVLPLESIRELDEVEDQGSELHRSPGDGAVKVKEGELQDLKLKHQSHQTETERLCAELRDSRERIGELESELSTERKKGEDNTHKILKLETDMSNSSLIAVLTECQSKVEQLEELKHSSLQLTAQLQAAQSMAVYLQRRMLCLEEEHMLKQQEVLKLTEQLEEAGRALQEKSTQVAQVTAQLQALHQELEKKQENGASSTDVLANGHTTSAQPQQQPRQYSNDSKVCTLL